ncbi:hypothetical protein Gocc_2109 [Gaiella occulta]|uniref:Polyketide cyclase / dehydrase and lipid transport n=1 Tax=Gaiella occulta TaxID=1002870 RepID=A0A7M2YV40_9ACTN|nr:hypothetical protein [Gaiella occulta]RDI74012.1 hypothetical protein Gocc_2109 [Gaiella occulta]
MRPYAVVVRGDPEEVARRLRDRLATGEVVVDGVDVLVARFAGEAGPLRYHTTELVTFSDREIAFEHLAGSFHGCHERFRFLDAGGGRTRVEHSGAFTMRGGLLGWILAVVVVRRLFESHVAEHMRGFGSEDG